VGGRQREVRGNRLPQRVGPLPGRAEKNNSLGDENFYLDTPPSETTTEELPAQIGRLVEEGSQEKNARRKTNKHSRIRSLFNQVVVEGRAKAPSSFT